MSGWATPTAVAHGLIAHASKRQWARKRLVSAFPSLTFFVQYRYYRRRWLPGRKQCLVWKPDRVTQISIWPIAAQNDEVIPLASTESLYKRLPRSLATLTVIKGVGRRGCATRS